jgi:PAS domain S-box-containing protein
LMSAWLSLSTEWVLIALLSYMLGGIILVVLWRLRSNFPRSAAEKILDVMPDSLIETDAQGRIVRVNASFLKLSGYTNQEACRLRVSEVLLDKRGEEAAAQLTVSEAMKNYETALKTKTGILRKVMVYGSVVRGRGGGNIVFAYVLHDVTDQKQAEAKLALAERFAPLGQLAGMISHDLRNPLNNVNTAAYYLKNHYSAQMDATGNQMLQTIEKSIAYSNKMITDLLDYSGEVKLELEVTTLKLVLAKSFAYVIVPPNIEVVDATDSCPQIMLDESKISRVLVNLIKNAIDAMPNGGTLTVTCKEVAGNLELTLRDTGLGMTPETQAKLWTPLFTTKTKGLGFGLMICKRIVEAHGGKIRVESQLGMGTSFTLVFPLKTQ